MINKTPNPRLKDSEWFWGARPYASYAVQAVRTDGMETVVKIELTRGKNMVEGSVFWLSNSGVHRAWFKHASGTYTEAFFKVRQDIRRWLNSHGLKPTGKHEGAL